LLRGGSEGGRPAMSTIVVAGAIANKVGKGGEAWVRLSWAKGMARLGADVHVIEEIDAATCVDAGGGPCDIERSVNLRYFRQLAAAHGLAATLVADDGRTFGASVSELHDLARDADLLVNISGHLRRPELLR